jgi:hypothetical protein
VINKLCLGIWNEFKWCHHVWKFVRGFSAPGPCMCWIYTVVVTVYWQDIRKRWAVDRSNKSWTAQYTNSSHCGPTKWIISLHVCGHVCVCHINKLSSKYLFQICSSTDFLSLPSGNESWKYLNTSRGMGSGRQTNILH